MDTSAIAGLTNWKLSMQVGDLVKFNYLAPHKPGIGIVTKVDGTTIWWTDTEGYRQWTYFEKLEVLNASR